MMGYLETTTLMQKYNIPLPPFQLVQAAAEAVTAAKAVGFPVTLKAVSPDLSHKSDRGLVKLGLETTASVEAAAAELLTAVKWGQDATMEGLLVQQMVLPGVEMIVGIHHDAQFGPVVALGSGGVLVELLDDAVLRLPPLTNQQAMEMVRASKSYRLLQGYRHYSAADIPALAELLVNVARMAAAEDGHIIGLDLNPVIVQRAGQGVSVVDVRVEIASKGERGR